MILTRPVHDRFRGHNRKPQLALRAGLSASTGGFPPQGPPVLYLPTWPLASADYAVAFTAAEMARLQSILQFCSGPLTPR